MGAVLMPPHLAPPKPPLHSFRRCARLILVMARQKHGSKSAKTKAISKAANTVQHTKDAKPAPPNQAKPERPVLTKSFPVVGIGASAGGLEAFTDLLKHIPADTGMAYVFVQHLDPTRPSMLTELLARATPMPVATIHDSIALQRDHVYIIPPGNNVVISDGSLSLIAYGDEFKHMPVDIFFRSLAESEKSRAIGVVLSGTATDGTLGLKAIKAEGGITFAQDDKSAKYSGMPRSAIAAGCVDFVMSPAAIARELAKLGRHPYVNPPKAARSPAVPFAEGDEGLDAIFRILRNATGVDFAFYKHPTIHRRILRRMVLRQKEDLSAYIKTLKQEPAEVDALYQDLLINVTGFFRDPEIYELLHKTVFPAIVKSRAPESPIRIWVPGCSTGEEAYSIAICLVEFLQGAGLGTPIQIFGTDISDAAIERARAGIYAENVVADVPKERMRRFFTRVDRGYQISSSIREMCIFARQNLAKDPPFSRLDLISCRNVLIYLGALLQKKILSLFHYALKPGAFLLLGSSETVGTQTDEFSIVDKKHRLFTRKPGLLRAALEFPSQPAADRRDLGKRFDEYGAFELQKEADRVILSHFAPPGVVVDEDFRILQFRGKTGAYLEPAAGDASLNLLKMAREGLTLDLRAALYAAKRKDAVVRKEGVTVKSNGGIRSVDLEVLPLRSPTQDRHFVVVFEDRTPAPEGEAKKPSPAEPARKADRETARLRDELAATRQYLQSIIEEQEATNEELKSANEEIQSSNEELQSTNEELETAKEELQSANEELTTVNEELQNRNSELVQVNNDLSNLLASVSIPIVMLGPDLRIRRFTPLAEKALNLIPTDVGRPLMDIKPNVEVPNLEALLREVIDTLTIKELEVQDRNGTWYSMWIRPYKTTDNKIDGAVLSLLDVDALKRSYEDARSAREYAEAIVETIREPLLVLDGQLRVKTANRSYYQMFRSTRDEVEGRKLSEAGRGEWNIDALREALVELAAHGRRFQELEVEQDFDRLGRRTMLLSGRPIGSKGSGNLFLLAIDDITERKRADEARYRCLFEASRDGVIIADAETGRITDINPFMTEWLGRAPSELLGKRFWTTGVFQDSEGAELMFRELQEKSAVRFDGVPLKTSGGPTVEAEIVGNIYLEAKRKVLQLNLRDVTERRRSEDQIKGALQEKEVLLKELHHRVKNNLQMISSLVNLQAKYASLKQAREMLGDLGNRVRSLASIHELLYNVDGLDEVRIADYVRHIADHLFRSYAVDPSRVKLNVTVDPAIRMSIERAIPCGLIVNELISNAMKHAFPQDRNGGIQVRFQQADSGSLDLMVSDDGVGLPKDFNPSRDGTLGLQLVRILAEQLGGTVDVGGEGSTEFRVRFPARGRGEGRVVGS